MHCDLDLLTSKSIWHILDSWGVCMWSFMMIGVKGKHLCAGNPNAAGQTDGRTWWFQYTPPNFVAGGITITILREGREDPIRVSNICHLGRGLPSREFCKSWMVFPRAFPNTMINYFSQSYIKMCKIDIKCKLHVDANFLNCLALTFCDFHWWFTPRIGLSHHPWWNISPDVKFGRNRCLKHQKKCSLTNSVHMTLPTSSFAVKSTRHHIDLYGIKRSWCQNFNERIKINIVYFNLKLVYLHITSLCPRFATSKTRQDFLWIANLENLDSIPSSFL